MNFKSFLLACSLVLLMGTGAFANNMLVQNVTTLGNDAVNKTIQVQFDISWDNSWRDEINYDAAWIFMKFKNASGVWQHVQLNQAGFVAGIGTANTVQVTADKVGSWLFRSGLGSGTFTSTGMQLQWNYGLAGLTSVTGLEVRVFAVEMVYVPEGEFNCAKRYAERSSSPGASYDYNYSLRHSLEAPGDNFPIINTFLSPIINSFTMNCNSSLTLTSSVRIKGDAGIDTNLDGIIDNTTFPIGYKSFYCFKYELTEQQYADFLNTLQTNQQVNLVGAGLNITFNNGLYYSSQPNQACGSSNGMRFLAFADWSGLRPISILEFNKASYGPFQPIGYSGVNHIRRTSPSCPSCCQSWLFVNDQFLDYFVTLYPASGDKVFYYAGNGINQYYGGIGDITQRDRLFDVGSLANQNSNKLSAGASYYGILDLTGNAIEPVVRLENISNFSSVNGDGSLSVNGSSNVPFWPLSSQINYIDMYLFWLIDTRQGFRYVRSAE